MRQVTAEALGRELAEWVLDPELCRIAAEALRDLPRPDPVGCCEIAFARAAVVKFIVNDTQSAGLAVRINAGVDESIAHMFKGAHTPQTAAWYGEGDLGEAAAKGIEQYMNAAFWSDRVAKTMADRLGLPRPSPIVAKGFSKLTEDIVIAITRVKIR